MGDVIFDRVAFAAGVFAGAATTLLTVLFALRAHRSNGLFTGLTLIFGALTLNYLDIVLRAIYAGDVPDASAVGFVARMGMLVGALSISWRLLREEKK